MLLMAKLCARSEDGMYLLSRGLQDSILQQATIHQKSPAAMRAITRVTAVVTQTPGAAESLVRAGFAPKIVQTLSRFSDNRDIAMNSAETIQNLSQDAEIRATLMQGGVLPALVGTLSMQIDHPLVLARVMSALTAYGDSSQSVSQMLGLHTVDKVKESMARHRLHPDVQRTGTELLEILNSQQRARKAEEDKRKAEEDKRRADLERRLDVVCVRE